MGFEPISSTNLNAFSYVFDWQVGVKFVKWTEWQYQYYLGDTKGSDRLILSVKIQKQEKKKSKLKKWLTNLQGLGSENEWMLFDLLLFKETGMPNYNSPNDGMRFYSYGPNYPEVLLAGVINRALGDANLKSKIDSLLLQNIAEGMLEHPHSLGEMGHLFMAALMFNSNKTIHLTAGEWWYQATARQQLDHHLLGKQLGILFQSKYGPLKRFVDLINQQMQGNSPLHEIGLKQLLDCFLTYLSDKPPIGLRKLLEIYLETLKGTGQFVPIGIRDKLMNWNHSKSLKKVIATIND